ncbi:MAG: alpha/beta hydrolase [Clostridia bacterium]|nr:alpha/beta hydrolase [Clostridia bacterium]
MINNYIYEKDYPRLMAEQVMPYLESHRQDLTFSGWDGNPLHCAVFHAEEEKGTLVICHGFTESCEKFHELTYYFLTAGLNVLIPEHRGHGLSYRAVEDRTLVHVNRFEEYVDDFALLMDNIVLPEYKHPHYLFAHSMGGAIGAMYMERYPAVFEKAVLSSPMIAPSTGSTPYGIAKGIFGTLCFLGSGKKRSIVSKEYPGYERFEDASRTSRVRFDEYETLREVTPTIQTYSPSCRWVWEAAKVKNKILRKGEPEKIKTEILLYNADGDTLVLPEPQQAFIHRVENGHFCVAEHAKHEIYGSEDSTLKPYLESIFTFFQI